MALSSGSIIAYSLGSMHFNPDSDCRNTIYQLFHLFEWAKRWLKTLKQNEDYF